MSDPTLSAIDRVFDLVDNSVEKIDRVLNRTKYTEEQHAFRRAKLPVVIDTAATVKVKKKKEASAKASAGWDKTKDVSKGAWKGAKDAYGSRAA